MKKTILFTFAIFTMFLSSNVIGQVQSSGDNGAMTGNTGDRLKCCPKIYVAYPAATPGGRVNKRLLTSNPFKGRNQGIDLSYDVLDPNGSIVPEGVHSITTSGGGDLILDASKLPAGKKYRLRLKSGSATEFYNF